MENTAASKPRTALGALKRAMCWMPPYGILRAESASAPKRGPVMRHSSVFSRSFALILFLVSSAFSIQAQTVMGTIVGTVTDAGGALVPGAQIAAENAGTHLQRTAQT